MSNYYDYLPCSSLYQRQTNQPPVTPYFNSPAMPFMQTMPSTLPMPASQGMPTYPLPPIGSTVPTGLPVGQNLVPPPMIPGVPQTVPGEISPMTTQDMMYTPGFLRTQIGSDVRIEFLIGTNSTTDRIGKLVGVGTSYVLLRLQETDDILLADLYSIKFVTFYH